MEQRETSREVKEPLQELSPLFRKQVSSSAMDFMDVVIKHSV